MAAAHPPSHPSPLAPAARQEAASWAAGLAFTFALFFGLARIERVAGAREPEIADLPVVALPFEAPPVPKPSEPPPPDEAPPPLTGIEASASDSPVRIAVVPPDLAALLPPQRLPAAVSLSRLYADLKPRADLEMDPRRVYQQSEVDQRPRAIVRVAPPVSTAMLGQAQALDVNLLLLIDAEGRTESIRVLRSSGQREFDALAAATVKQDWVFSPAVKRGRKVRCLAEQSVRVAVGGSRSPFDTQ